MTRAQASALACQIDALETVLRELRQVQRDLEGETPTAPLPSGADFYTDLGQQIAAQRKHLRLTQAGLGRRIGETGLTISRWETAQRRPSTYDIARLAAAGVVVHLTRKEQP